VTLAVLYDAGRQAVLRGFVRREDRAAGFADGDAAFTFSPHARPSASITSPHEVTIRNEYGCDWAQAGMCYFASS